MNRMGSVVLLAVLSAGCTLGDEDRAASPTPLPTPSPSDSSPSPTQDAVSLSLCQRALPGAEIASAMATTVGAVREWRTGPGVQMGEDKFRPLPDTAPAAWCWTHVGPRAFAAWGVSGPTAERVKFAEVRGFDATPSGAPAIP